MVHSWATDKDDATVQPRWGKIGKQKIEDAGTLYPKRMETVDDEILANALKFTDKAKADGKPFFLWLNPTRMHVETHLSEKYESMRTPEKGWSIEEAGMAQIATSWLGHLNTSRTKVFRTIPIIAFTTDNGTKNFTWPDGGQTRSQGERAGLKAAGGALSSSVGPATSRQTRSNGIFSGWTGSPPSLLRQAIPTSPGTVKRKTNRGKT